MELLTAIIIGFAIASSLTFIYVIVWGIRGLSRKDEVRPVHIRPSDLYSSNLAYGSGYHAYDYLGNPVPGPYDPNLSSAYAMGNYMGAGQYVGYSRPSVYAGSDYSAYYAGNYGITGKFPTDEYGDTYSEYGEQVLWDEPDPVYEKAGPPQPRIVPKMPMIVDEGQGSKEQYTKEHAEYPEEMVSPASALVVTDRSGGPFAGGRPAESGTAVDRPDTSMFGYPALASSEPKALGPVEAAAQEFYDVMDYSYTAQDLIPSPSAMEEDHRDVSSDYSQDIPTLVPVEPRKPRVEKRNRPFKHTLDESTKCNICLGFIKTGLPLLTCVCSKSFHVSCACRMGQCPICTSDLLDYDDLTAPPESKGPSDGEIALLRMIDDGGGSPEEPLSDILAPVTRTVAALTDTQREKLKRLLGKYESSQQNERQKSTDFSLE